MILKKPYAFIIKHFRAIHMVMLLPMFFLITQTKRIVNFFYSYVGSGYSFQFNDVLSNLAGNYINLFMYAAIIIILVVYVTLSLFLQEKEKPTKYYNLTIVYYVIMFVLLSVGFKIFQMVENDTLSSTMARIIRDLTFVVHYSQYIVLIYTLVRGSGFDIKKFDFKTDLLGLEITSEDSEEIELLTGTDPYKVKRTVRRFLRELKYYYYENKFIFTIVIVIAVGILGTIMFLNREAYQKVYKEKENFAFGYVNVKIKDSFISNLSHNGNVINSGKTYVILELEIHNRYNEDKVFNYDNFRLLLSHKRLVSPNIVAANNFIDYGNPYSGSAIKSNTSNTYILVYEIDEKDIAKKYKISAFSSYDAKVGGVGAINKEVKIAPSRVPTSVNKNSVSMGSTFNFSRTNLKNTNVTISDYQLTNRFEYSYVYCPNNGYCVDSKNAASLSPNEIGMKKFLVIDYKLNLDPGAKYMAYTKDYKSFFQDFMKIEYKINSKTYNAKVNIMNPTYYSDKLILKVPSNISMASSIEAVIAVRNISYSVKLK